MALYQLDARGLLCPMPVIKTQNKAKDLKHGDQLTILASDPGAIHDLPSWTRINGHKLLDCQQLDNEIRILIEIVKEEP